jgi:predicted lysophospholipase L1 biosynthesis ABC-type transport system permease subunit
MLARKYFPDGNAVGRRMKHGTPTSPLPWMRIVGVVGNVKHNGLEWDFLPESFVPYPQISGRYAKVVAKDIIVSLRARHDVAALQKSAQASVRALDGGLPIVDMISAPDLVAATTERPRFRTWLVATFAVIALVLASVGLYGVVSQAVAQRTREIGIRMALGATRASVVRLVVGWGLVVAAAGTLVGMAATFAAGRIIQSLLYGVGAYDPRTVATVVAVMFVVAVAASLIPAQRATSIDPLDTLRAE